MTFQDDLSRALAEACKDQAKEARLAALAMDLAPITVRKHSGYVLITPELLDAADAHPGPPAPWSRRLRWRWQAWREKTGRKVGGWLAGVDLTERDEDW